MYEKKRRKNIEYSYFISFFLCKKKKNTQKGEQKNISSKSKANMTSTLQVFQCQGDRWRTVRRHLLRGPQDFDGEHNTVHNVTVSGWANRGTRGGLRCSAGPQRCATPSSHLYSSPGRTVCRCYSRYRSHEPWPGWIIMTHASHSYWALWSWSMLAWRCWSKQSVGTSK